MSDKRAVCRGFANEPLPRVLPKLPSSSSKRNDDDDDDDDDDGNRRDDDGWGSFSAAVVDLAVRAGVQHAAVFAHDLLVAATPAWDHLPVDDHVALQAGSSILSIGAITGPFIGPFVHALVY